MSLSETLLQILAESEPNLRAISDEKAKEVPAPGKWSKIQILGHLIDSGVNNLVRFVRAQKVEGLMFDGYDQEFWVEANAYQDSDWAEVITLWVSLNKRVAMAIAQIPQSELTRPRDPHSISWPLYAPKSKDEPFTLAFLIKDYIGHIENHLRQIFPEFVPKIFHR